MATADREAELKRTATFWDNKIKKSGPPRNRWWVSNAIIQHINRNVCGEAVPGLNQGLVKQLQAQSKDLPYKKGLSIGCGAGQKELKLIRQGIVEHFDLYEISEERRKLALQNASQAGLAERITLHGADFFRAPVADRYDFVHWDNSLHHMEDTDDAVLRTFEALLPGGCFFMNDFVGKARFQWSDEELAHINAFRATLPAEVFVNPENGAAWSRVVSRPSVKRMIDEDPSEAADSESILPALRKYMEPSLLRTTGGVIYHTGLNNILANLPEDSALLARALDLDDRLNARGLCQYAVCLAFR